jgi:hypothetical protein
MMATLNIGSQARSAAIVLKPFVIDVVVPPGAGPFTPNIEVFYVTNTLRHGGRARGMTAVVTTISVTDVTKTR